MSAIQKDYSAAWASEKELHGVMGQFYADPAWGRRHISEHETSPIIACAATGVGIFFGHVQPVVFFEHTAPFVRVSTNAKKSAANTSAQKLADKALAHLRKDIADKTALSLTDVALVGIPKMREQAIWKRRRANNVPKRAIWCGRRWSSVGARVYTGLDQAAVLTAGHGATRDAEVYSSERNVIGRVERRMCTATDVHGYPVPNRKQVADVAVVIFERGIDENFYIGAPPCAGLGSFSLEMKVTSYGAYSTASSTSVHHLSTWTPFYDMEGKPGALGDTFWTSAAISVEGDSGAPVYDDQNRLLGHIIGGVEGEYSVVQSAEYQFRAAQVTFRIGARNV